MCRACKIKKQIKKYPVIHSKKFFFEIPVQVIGGLGERVYIYSANYYLTG